MRVLVVQTVVPEYRTPVFEELVRRLGKDTVKIVAGSTYFDPTLRTECSPELVEIRRTLFLFGRKFAWQVLPIWPVLRSPVVVAELNPRILSTWALLIARRAMRHPTILWGHAWPRGGREQRSEAVRSRMRRLATVVITYTDGQAQELMRASPRLRVVAAPNALYSSSARPLPAADSEPGNAFIVVGRLVDIKNVELAIRAFGRAVGGLSDDARLVVVGDGPARESLRTTAAQAGLASRVDFVGTLYDIEALEKIFSRSVATVAPGPAGLTVIQSHYFGVPCFAATGQQHGPEIEAVSDGVNGGFFAPDAEALSQLMRRLWEDRASWSRRRRAIAVESRQGHSIETMVDRMLEAVRLAAG